MSDDHVIVDEIRVALDRTLGCPTRPRWRSQSKRAR